MNIKKPVNFHFGMAGRFTIHKGRCDEHGNPVESSKVQVADFDNLLLNDGLDAIGGYNSLSSAEQMFYYCEVGTGTTAPAVTDTALATYLARTATVQETTYPRDIVGSPNYVAVRKTFRFGQGAAAGNLTEVGIRLGTSLGKYWSRALIKDGLGNPTSITVLSDEFLDVTYEFRLLIPETDVTGTITLDGVLRDFIIRPCEIDQLSNTSPGWFSGTSIATHGPRVYPSGSAFQVHYASAGNLTARELAPAAMTAGAISSRTTAAYTPGNYYRDFTLVWGLTQAIASPIRTIVFTIENLGSYQCQFDPPLAKTNEMTLSLTFRFSWGRA